MNLINSFRILPLLVVLAGCASQPERPMDAMKNIDMPKFMGDWFVIANIPTFAERDAVSPMENYRLRDDGTVAITFSYKNANSQASKELSMKGFVGSRPDNGVWRVQWLWPFKADYRIVYLDDEYQFSIVGREKRDYLWIMSRTPNINEAQYEALVAKAVEIGYERAAINRTSWQQPLRDAG